MIIQNHILSCLCRAIKPSTETDAGIIGLVYLSWVAGLGRSRPSGRMFCCGIFYNAFKLPLGLEGIELQTC